MLEAFAWVIVFSGVFGLLAWFVLVYDAKRPGGGRMTKHLTVHLKDSPRQTWLEFDGEPVEGIESVLVSYEDRTIDGLVALHILGRVHVENEQGTGE